MSYREQVEQEIRGKVILKLEQRGGDHKMAWLNPAIYDRHITFDTSLPLEPIREAKVIVPVHSYEVFDYDDGEMEKYIELVCHKIEVWFTTYISEITLGEKIAYVSGPLKIELQYRITLVTILYNLVEI
jgi:hypothetical protein